MSSPLSVKQCQVTGFTDFTAEQKSEVFQCPPGCSSTALMAMVALVGGSSMATLHVCHITGTTTHRGCPSLTLSQLSRVAGCWKGCPCPSGFLGGFPVFLCHPVPPGDWHWALVTNEPGLFLLADTRFGLMALHWSSVVLVKTRSGPCLQNSCIHILW